MITSVKIKDNTKTPFEYVSDIEAFENGREFIFKPGVNVIIGKNGSGKSTIGSKNPIMGILEENRTFISSRPGCILCRLDEMESWAYLDDLLP